MLGGAIWGAIPGYLRAKTGAHEVIVTIMLNFIALRLVDYLLAPQVEARLAALPGGCTAVGVAEARPGIRCRLADGGTWEATGDGYQHFRDGHG